MPLMPITVQKKKKKKAQVKFELEGIWDELLHSKNVCRSQINHYFSSLLGDISGVRTVNSRESKSQALWWFEVVFVTLEKPIYTSVMAESMQCMEILEQCLLLSRFFEKGQLKTPFWTHFYWPERRVRVLDRPVCSADLPLTENMCNGDDPIPVNILKQPKGLFFMLSAPFEEIPACFSDVLSHSPTCLPPVNKPKYL